MLDFDRIRFDPMYRWVWIGYLTLFVLAGSVAVGVACLVGWL